MATASDSSQMAASNAALQSQIAASTAAQTKDDPSDIFELLTACFDHAVSFLGKVSPIKVSGLVSTGITANINPEASAPIPTSKNIMPGSMSATGGALAKGAGKVFNFKNLWAGLSAPAIEALAAIGETVHNVSSGELFTFHPAPTPMLGKSSGIDYERI